ncbi:DinB family protein [Ginsengibacter hankyongi]|uniref:DinB family protein n=1 Tax=Ginsengibacter hankyongi TaxID=2607284 RepID=A0A5J5IGA0_9BACT|nr:DinB family protein [Ginsengibacter hankyongi]KAA9037154.1 DinB family protein [Ginsengibacter hankyongi]
MTTHIKTIRDARAWLLEQVKDVSISQFNQIPPGFTNNICWNMGHLVAVQQAICYKNAGLPLSISDDFWKKFRSGSKPDVIFGECDIIQIKQLLITTLDQLETDYINRVFANYTAWSTRIGTKITSIDDGLEFLAFHERLHSGTITALKRLVSKNDLDNA